MKIILREWRTDDAKALAEILNNGNLQRYLRDLPYPYSESDAADFINYCLNSDKEREMTFAIEADGELAGCISAARGTNISRFNAEIGYYISERLQRKGIATFAVREFTDYVFRNSDTIRLFATVFEENIPSRKVLEKAGFACEGTLESAAVKQGRLKNIKMYALTRQKYNERG